MFTPSSDLDSKNDDSPEMIRVAKWPFWLADGILLVFAIMLFAHAGGQPSASALLLMVLLVTVGAMAFVTPYLFELLLRYRMLLDRWEEMAASRPQRTQIAQLQANLESLRKSVAASIDSQSEERQQALAGLSETLGDLERRFAGFVDSQQSINADYVKQLESLRELAAAAPPPPPAAAPEEAPEPESIVPEAIEVSAAPETAQEDPAPTTPEPKLKPAVRRGLLQQAIKQGESSGNGPAVKRIIGRTFSPKPKPPVADTVDSEEPLSRFDSEEEPEPQVSDESTAETSVETPAPDAVETTRAEPEPAPKETSNEDTVSSPEETTEPAQEAPAEKETASEKTAAAIEGGEDKVVETNLFPDLPASPKYAAKAKKNETQVIAKVLIGIGNKPYIRGDLPGLHTDKGVPMDFREIGVWQWASPDVVEPGHFRIYRNDKDPEKSDGHAIEPGQHLEIKPVFAVQRLMTNE